MPSIEDLKAAKGELRAQLLQIGLSEGVVGRRATVSVSAAVRRAGQNIHALGIGRKISDGSEGELCVRIYIVQKLPTSLIAPRDLIPAKIDGIPTDIVEAEPPFLFARRPTVKKPAKKAQARKPAANRGRSQAADTCSQNKRKRQRPVIAGISAGHRDITAGTIACFCRSTKVGDDAAQRYLLSNNHVFADVNKASIGNPIYQPGPADGGGLQDYFAKLKRFVPINLGGQQPNLVDGAIVELLSGVEHEARICSIGRITGTDRAKDGMKVWKHGRTTGLTEGHVDDIDYDGLVGMDHNDPNVAGLFENQIRIVSDSSAPIGLGGDSGSLVLSKTKAVGLYFAGPESGNYGLANHISNVLSGLQIELI